MKASKKVKAGDILFRVDPQKLVIACANVVEVSDGYVSVTEKSRSSVESKALKRIESDKFPTEYDGILYFKTKDDAEKFVKTQVGI